MLNHSTPTTANKPQAFANQYLAFAGKAWRDWQVKLVLGSLALTALGAAAWFWWATARSGIGIRTDSVAYIWAAQNLVKGIGLGRLTGAGTLKPMTHWPPLYSILLAGAQLVGTDVFLSARWMGALFFGLMIFLFGLTIYRLTGSFGFALGGAAVLLASPSLWVTSLFAMSEPLYVTLTLAAGLALDQYLRGNKRGWFIAASLGIALALLTRYVGIALAAAAGLTLLTYPKWPWRRRISESLALGLLACLPMAIWTVYNQFTAGTATNRVFEYFPIAASDWTLASQTVQGWLQPLPTIFDIGLRKATGGLAAAAFAWFLQRTEPRPAAAVPPPERPFPILGRLTAVYAVLYFAFIVLSRLFFDRAITIFEERILFPEMLCLLLLSAWAWNALTRRLGHWRWWAGAALAAVAIFAAISFFTLYRDAARPTIQLSRERGLGLAPARLDPPAVVRAFLALPADRVVYTDNIEELYISSGRYSYQVNETTLAGIERLKTAIGQKKAVFVLLRSQDLYTLLKAGMPELQEVFHEGSSAILITP